MLDRHEQLRRETVLLDVTLTIASLGMAYWLRWLVVEPGLSTLPYLALLPGILPLWVFLLTFFGAYREPQATSPILLFGAVTRGVATGLVLLLTFLFFLKVQHVSRVVMFTFAAVDIAALSGVRLAMAWRIRRTHRRGEGRRSVLVVGSGSRARHLAATLLDRTGPSVDIIGFLDPDATVVGHTVFDGGRVVGTVDEISSVLKAHVVDEVVLAVPRGMMTAVEKVVRACEEEGVKVSIMADFFDVNVARMTLDTFRGLPLLTLEPVAHVEWKLVVKRLVDMTVALVALPILLPLMIVIAVAVKLDSPGAVLFVQDRVGLNKRTFRMLKFRTMVAGSERLQSQLEAQNEAEGPVFKIANDPRITWIGKLLRQTSLDELPQLVNVLKGDMSLVGPRPLPLRDVNLFDRGIQRRRFSVKPGITGFWQVAGRSNLPFSRWLELDLWYIEHWTLGLDLRILLRTIPAVLLRSGAR